jgi:hypothetical protein
MIVIGAIQEAAREMGAVRIHDTIFDLRIRRFFIHFIKARQH